MILKVSGSTPEFLTYHTDGNMRFKTDLEDLKAINLVPCEKSEQTREVLAALFCMGLILLGSLSLRSVPKSLPSKPLDEESERQKLFCKLSAVPNKAARNKRNR